MFTAVANHWNPGGVNEDSEEVGETSWKTSAGTIDAAKNYIYGIRI